MGYLALTLGARKSNIVGLLIKICRYLGRVLSAESADAVGLDGSKSLVFEQSPDAFASLAFRLVEPCRSGT